MIENNYQGKNCLEMSYKTKANLLGFALLNL